MAATERAPEKDSDDGIAFVVSSPLRLDQLDDEIARAHSWTDDAGLTTEGDPALASTANPVVVYVGHAGVNQDATLKAFEEHTPSTDYAIEVSFGVSLEAVQAKALRKEALTPED